MKKSTNKILTTHTGSLPRPEDLQHMLEAQDRGEQIDRVAFEARVQEAVKVVVQSQASCSIDVDNARSMFKISYSTLDMKRVTGIDDSQPLLTYQQQVIADTLVRGHTDASSYWP